MVAVSYARPDAARVTEFCDALRAAGVEVFDYAQDQRRLLGRPLRQALHATFGARTTVCVAFASEAYRTRAWTNLELTVMLVHRRFTRCPRLLPVSLDGTTLPLLGDVAHWRLGHDSPIGELVKAVVDADAELRRRGQRLRLASVAAALVAVTALAGNYAAPREAQPSSHGDLRPLVAGQARPASLLAAGAATVLPPFVHTRVTRGGIVVCERTTDADGVLPCDLPPGLYTVSADTPLLLNPTDMYLSSGAP